MRRHFVLAGALLLAACGGGDPDPREAVALPPILERLQARCGEAFQTEGLIDGLPEIQTLHIHACDEWGVDLALHIGNDRSRSWRLALETELQVCENPPPGETRCELPVLRLRHFHHYENGFADTLSDYGGGSTDFAGETVEFPADFRSIALFQREGFGDLATAVWTLTVTETALVYRLDYPRDSFEQSFDLTETVEAPPPPWVPED